MGNDWIPYDTTYDMYRRQDGNLFVSKPINDKVKLDALHTEGFRLVAWKGNMYVFYRAGFSLPNYVEEIDDLSVFFGIPIRGKAITNR